MPARRTSKRVLLAPAAGLGVGGGHLMRCLTLAGALVDRGAACAFVVNETGATLLERFGQGAFALHVETTETALNQGVFDALVIDDYGVSADQENAFRRCGPRIVVIDDLNDRAHRADLLINPSYGRTDAETGGGVSGRRLMGARYALVRSEFSALREGALARPVAGDPRYAFMSFGLSDVDRIAARATAALRARFADVALNLALASDAESAESLKQRATRDQALHLHFDAQNVAALMAEADLAIGAGGASTWERCCLGLPTLAVIVADNQRAMIQQMAADGALLAVDLRAPDFEDAFAAALDRLWDQSVRTALREKSAGLCDGLGAARVAEAILAL